MSRPLDEDLIEVLRALKRQVTSERRQKSLQLRLQDADAALDTVVPLIDFVTNIAGPKGEGDGDVQRAFRILEHAFGLA